MDYSPFILSELLVSPSTIFSHYIFENINQIIDGVWKILCSVFKPIPIRILLMRFRKTKKHSTYDTFSIWLITTTTITIDWHKIYEIQKELSGYIGYMNKKGIEEIIIKSSLARQCDILSLLDPFSLAQFHIDSEKAVFACLLPLRTMIFASKLLAVYLLLSIWIINKQCMKAHLCPETCSDVGC